LVHKLSFLVFTGTSNLIVAFNWYRYKEFYDTFLTFKYLQSSEKQPIGIVCCLMKKKKEIICDHEALSIILTHFEFNFYEECKFP